MYFQMSFMPLQSKIEIDTLLKAVYHNNCFAVHLEDIPICKTIFTIKYKRLIIILILTKLAWNKNNSKFLYNDHCLDINNIPFDILL